MVVWWYTLSLMEQIFATVGVVATVLLIVQIVLTILGAANDAGTADGADFGADAAADFDTSGLDADFGANFDAGGFDADFDGAGFDADGFDADLPDPADATMADGHIADGAHGSGLRLFTMQGIISFAAIFGWSGLLLMQSGVGNTISLILATVFGFAAMLVMAFILRGMLRLQQDGTLNIRNAIGKSGTVYLPIYPHRAAPGKVTLMVQNRLVELEAVTDDEEKIETGRQVVVTGISGTNTLIVAKK